jgi:hypothetical protein
MTESEKISVIMHEYDTLRDEIVQRNNSTQQQIYIGVGVLLGTITLYLGGHLDGPKMAFLCGFLIIAISVFCYAMWSAYRDIHKNAARLREIEEDVNARAGEELLRWERYWGGAVTGFFFGDQKPLSRPYR